MLKVYETRKQGGQRKYLVDNDDVKKLVGSLRKAQIIRNRFLNIAVQEYKGKKYNNCVWIVEG